MKKAFVVFVVLLLTAAASFTAGAQDAASWSCLVCGVDETNEACHDCEIEHGSWICPKCGTINTGDTCSECGIAKSDLTIEKYDNGNYYIGELKNGNEMERAPICGPMEIFIPVTGKKRNGPEMDR